LPRRRFSTFAVSIVAMFAFGLGHYTAGDASSDDPQGGTNPWCEKEELPPVPNGTDMEVSGNRTNCATLAKDSLVYVHLHRKGQPESRSSLIFRYDGNDPKIRWIDNDHVSIKADGISSVSKQVTLFDDISIDYDLFMPRQSQLDQVPYNPVRARDAMNRMYR